MSDTNVENTNENLNESAESTSEVAQETVETTEGNEHENGEGKAESEKPAKFEPWKIKHEKKEVESVPYGRFREVNQEKNEYAKKVSELEAELDKYTKRAEELDKIKSPEDIKISDYDDPEEYLKARDTAIKNQAIKEVEERFIAREQARLIEAQNAEIIKNYTNNLEASFKRNPEIKEVVEWFDQYANNLHQDVAHELLLDENVGELIYNFSTDQTLLTKLFKGDPKEVIRMIHKMSAKMDHSSTNSKSESDSSKESSEAPKALTKKIGVPTVVKSNKSPTKTLEDMSISEYREYLRKRNKR